METLASKERGALGHQYLIVTYVTIEGAGGLARVWSYELAAWLQSRPGTLIVGLRVA